MSLLCQQVPALPSSLCSQLEEQLNRLPQNWRPEESTGRRIARKDGLEESPFIHPDQTLSPVSFDHTGALTQEAITRQYRYLPKAPFETLQKVCRLALEAFAKAQGWKNQTFSMTLTFTQHSQLTEGKRVAGLPWHRDSADFSLACLLSDSQQWSGGLFLFRKKGENTHQSFSPSQGQALVFSNHQTQHCLDPFYVTQGGGTRTLLTLHAYSPPSPLQREE